MVEIVNQILAVATVAAQIISLVLLISLVIFWFTKKSNPVLNWFSANAVLAAFIVSLTATLGSLFYSEIAGYEPCKLCWFQRILMYPQVILFGLALKKKYVSTINNGIVLSVLGAIIAGYHYLGQIMPTTPLPCSALGYSVSCSQRFVMQFGYITIPLMAFSAFILIVLVLIAAKVKSRSTDSPSK